MKGTTLPGLLAVFFFLLNSSVAPAQGYPDYLLHQPFAIQYYQVDSLFGIIARYDSAKANNEIARLEKWADHNSDRELRYAFMLLRYQYSIVAKNRDNYFVEKNMPAYLAELDEKNLLYLEAEALNILANYYWVDYRKFGLAFEYSLAAYNIYSKFPDNVFPPKSEYLYSIGLAYYRFKDDRSALSYLMQAEKSMPYGKSPHYYNILNAIGLCYRQSGVYDSAEYYFQKSYELVKQQHVHIWQGIIGGNLGITYYYEQRYTEAIPLLEQDVQICQERNKYADNAVKSLAILGDCYLQLGNKAKGLAILQQSYQMVKDGNKWGNYDIIAPVYPLMAKAYAETGNYKLAYDFSDSAKRVSDSESSQKNALILAGAMEKTDIEKHKAEIREHQKELKIQFLIRIFFTISIALLLLVIFFIYRNYRNQKITNKLLSKEKKRSEDLLLNILPPEVADELKDKGVAEAKYFDHVTVMFTDFVNFTGAGEKMSPQQLIDELHHCFKAFDGIIDKYNIEKIKTIGDAYLAVSGLPVPDELHAEHIVNAAKEIIQFMCNRKKEIRDAAFDIRIGIHTGSVVAGIVGVKKFAYDIWGDAVNSAARMEQNSETGKINISQSTYDLVKDNFACTYRGEIEAKNKGMMSMYFVE